MVKRIEAPRTDGGAAESRTGGPGQVEDLAALAREAGQMQQDERAAEEGQAEQREHREQQQQQAQAASAASELAVFLGKGRNMLAKLLDRVDTLPEEKTLEIWTDDALEDVAGALIAIPGDHMEWLAALLAKYGPYFALAMALGPPSYVTYEAVRAHRAARKPVDVQATEVPGGQQQPA